MQDENLGPLYAKIPGMQHEIAQRYACDTTFREICLDYLELNRMVVRLSEAPLDTSLRMLPDYAGALKEIEDELRLVLNLGQSQTHYPTVNAKDKDDDKRNDPAESP